MSTYARIESHLGKGPTCWEWAANIIAQPAYWASESVIRAKDTVNQPGVWGNFDNSTIEKIRRKVVLFFLYGLGPKIAGAEGANHMGMGLLPLLPYLVSTILKDISNRLHPRKFTHIQGNAPEEMTNPNILTLNVCNYMGGMPINHGGLDPARLRIEPLAQLILNSKANTVVCQEMAYDAALRLSHRLRNDFSHFYTNIGPSPWTFESCLFVATRLPIENAQFIPFPNSTGMKRGFFCLETPRYGVVTTHMVYGTPEAAGVERRAQLEQINDWMKEAKERTGKPWILMGDLNIYRTGEENDEYSQSAIPENFYDNYGEGIEDLKVGPKTATCTNLLERNATGKLAMPHLWEIVDYALVPHAQTSFFRNIKVRLFQTFKLTAANEIDPSERAPTDHRGLRFTAELV